MRKSSVVGILTNLLILAASGSHPAISQIRWVGGETTIAPAMSPAELKQELTRLSGRAEHERVVIHLDGAVDAEQRAELESQGVRLLSYLGGDAYFARLAGRVAAADLSQGGRVVAVEPIQTANKLHPDLAAGVIRPWSIVSDAGQANPFVAAYVLFHRDVDLEREGLPAIQRHGGELRSWMRSINGAVIHLSFGNIPRLADDDAVMYLEPPLPELQELNNSNRARVGADTLQSPPLGLDGSGVDVLVFDVGQMYAHPDFGARLTIGAGDTHEISDHATHVGGTIGGDGSISGGHYRGMAPAVNLVSYGLQQDGGTELSEGFLYTDPGDLESDYAEAIGIYGADLSNNSIGTNVAFNGYPCSWEGNYGVTDALIDAIVSGSLGEPFRVVFSNGNERGWGDCGSDYRTTAPPSCAKGHITVGALNSDDDSMTDFTSWGPCDDGRMKPDVAGPGCQVDNDGGVSSTASGGGYTVKCGTSMAAPTVTGIGALLLQHFRSTYPGRTDFRNATLKAILAQTAVDVANPGPDYQTGYGSVRGDAAADVVTQERFIEGQVVQTEIYLAYVSVGPGDDELKVTLAWDDPPGTPNVDPALINDLDLRVVGPDQTVHLPWTLDPADPASPAVRTTPNRLDNIEQVRIDAPSPGTYRVEIEGFHLGEGPSQSFGLAAGPTLDGCLSQGIVSAVGSTVACEAQLDLTLMDCDLNLDSDLVETASVTISSDSEVSGEAAMLQETDPASARFQGSMQVSQTDGAGVLQVVEDDTVTIRYVDADDGMGGTDVETVYQLVVDCSAPVATSISPLEVRSNEATVAVELDEPAWVTVRYGEACEDPSHTTSDNRLSTQHEIRLYPLTHGIPYFFSVEIVDEAGNSATYDNGGACYSFTTQSRDSDQDGIPDTADNCVGNGNPDQQDADEDGIGDACDNCPVDSNPDQEESEAAESFGRRLLTDTADLVTTVFGADLDGDGDLDVLSSEIRENRIAWYENLDGAGSFGPARVISDTANGAMSVFAADIDGDEDLDVLSASANDDRIAWYENLDGAGSFGEPRAITDIADEARSVFAADLDGDDDVDVLSASSGNDLIAWYENLDGSGTFGPPREIGFGDWFVTAADVDGDGDLDVLSVSYRTDRFSWYENVNEPGDRFGLPQTIGSGNGPLSISAADLDGDLDLDLVVAYFLGDEISWYENTNHEGLFTYRGDLDDDADQAFSVVAVDLDQDGDADVLSASSRDDTVAWFENLDSSSGFGPKQVISDSADGARSIVALDFDDDGDLDVLAASDDDDTIALYINGADGFGDACDNCPLIENDDQLDDDADGLGNACDNCPDAANSDQLDVDRDGLGNLCDNCPELANPDQADADLDGVGDDCDTCTDTDGDGWGDPEVLTNSCAPDNCPDFVNPGQEDFDGDGVGDDCDICPGSAYDDSDDDIWCGNLDNCPLVTNFDQRDTDGDGRGDACDNCPSEFNPDQFDTDGTTQFGARHRLFGADGSFHTVSAADIDGDDDFDVVTWAHDRIAWFENVDGTGGFGPVRTIMAVDPPEFSPAAVVADIDGDVDLDVVWGFLGGRIAWSENLDGAGFFSADKEVAADGAEWKIQVLHAADLDGDGDLDLQCGARNSLSWYENLDGLGNFGPRRPILLGSHVSIDTADFDRDGDLDLMTCSSEPVNRVIWFENLDGAGDFSYPHTVTYTAGFPMSVAEDIDGDGDADIVVGDTGGPTIYWFENTDGAGTFGESNVILDTPGGQATVYPADVDGDGDPDLIATEIEENWIGWFENRDGAGDFGAMNPISEGISSESLAVADMDGDGDPDALIGSSVEAAWYENGADGVGDVCDNCLFARNPDQSNQDGDALGDACDNCPFLVNPDQANADGDVAGDLCDNCLSVPNDDQLDNDADGLGNACDNCPDVAGGTQDDSDDDLWGDFCDNCPMTPNPSQDNSDTDRHGDACDNCLFVNNHSQSDLDDDGAGDHCDVDDGVIFVWFSDRENTLWDSELGFDQWNWYRGDYEVFLTTGEYTQRLSLGSLASRRCGLDQTQVTDIVTLAEPGATVFYLVTGVAGGVEGDLGATSDGTTRPNDNACP